MTRRRNRGREGSKERRRAPPPSRRLVPASQTPGQSRLDTPRSLGRGDLGSSGHRQDEGLSLPDPRRIHNEGRPAGSRSPASALATGLWSYPSATHGSGTEIGSVLDNSSCFGSHPLPERGLGSPFWPIEPPLSHIGHDWRPFISEIRSPGSQHFGAVEAVISSTAGQFSTISAHTVMERGLERIPVTPNITRRGCMPTLLGNIPIKYFTFFTIKSDKHRMKPLEIPMFIVEPQYIDDRYCTNDLFLAMSSLNDLLKMEGANRNPVSVGDGGTWHHHGPAVHPPTPGSFAPPHDEGSLYPDLDYRIGLDNSLNPIGFPNPNYFPNPDSFLNPDCFPNPDCFSNPDCQSGSQQLEKSFNPNAYNAYMHGNEGASTLAWSSEPSALFSKPREAPSSASSQHSALNIQPPSGLSAHLHVNMNMNTNAKPEQLHCPSGLPPDWSFGGPMGNTFYEPMQTNSSPKIPVAAPRPTPVDRPPEHNLQRILEGWESYSK